MKYLSLLFLSFCVSIATAQNLTIVRDSQSPRATFGAEKLSEVAKTKGYSVIFADKAPKNQKIKLSSLAKKELLFGSKIQPSSL